MSTLHGLMDCPFSFRTRTTSEGLMVSNTKFPMAELDAKGIDTKEMLALLGGMYKQCNDVSLPTTKPPPAATGTDKDFLELYYKTEFDTVVHGSPVTSLPVLRLPRPTPAKVFDPELPHTDDHSQGVHRDRPVTGQR